MNNQIFLFHIPEEINPVIDEQKVSKEDEIPKAMPKIAQPPKQEYILSNQLT